MNWLALAFGLLAIVGFFWVVAEILRQERKERDEFTGGTEREP